jgi:hypothetical protein
VAFQEERSKGAVDPRFARLERRERGRGILGKVLFDLGQDDITLAICADRKGGFLLASPLGRMVAAQGAKEKRPRAKLGHFPGGEIDVVMIERDGKSGFLQMGRDRDDPATIPPETTDPPEV